MRLDGMTKVLTNLTLLNEKVTGGMKRVGEHAGRIIEKRAKENISGQHGHNKHIITGNLRSSIDTRVKEKGFALIQIEVGTDVRYAVYVETKSRDGGFLRPALFESKEKALLYIRLTLSGFITDL